MQPTPEAYSFLRDTADSLKDIEGGVMVNAAGDIGLASIKLMLSAGVRIVAINEPSNKVTVESLAAELGAASDPDLGVGEDGKSLLYKGQRIEFWQTFNPWEETFQDHSGPVVVLNCSGVGFDKETSQKFLDNWASLVILSGPPTDADIPLAMHGVTVDDVLTADTTLVSMASCTTNSACLGLKALHEAFELHGGTMETIHSATNSNGACDHWNTGEGILDGIALPGGSGALKLVGRIIPELEGVFAGGAMRVACSYGSITTLSLFTPCCALTVEKVNDVLHSAVPEDTPLFAYNDAANPAVSIGQVRKTLTLSLIDGAATKVVELVGGQGSLISVHFGYNNKWGFALGLIGLVDHWAQLQDTDA